MLILIFFQLEFEFIEEILSNVVEFEIRSFSSDYLALLDINLALLIE